MENILTRKQPPMPAVQSTIVDHPRAVVPNIPSIALLSEHRVTELSKNIDKAITLEELMNGIKGDCCLIHAHQSDIDRITGECQARANLLNRLLDHELKKDQIIRIAFSDSSIDSFILDKQLASNVELKKLYDAGIEAKAALPPGMEQLKYDLKAWLRYPMDNQSSDKFRNLKFTKRWQLDAEKLEQFFVSSGLKIYVAGSALRELRDVAELCRVFMQYEMPSQQIIAASFLSQRIEPYGRNLYRPRWTYSIER